MLHSFYRLEDGSHLAFFEAPDMHFEFKPQHDFDLDPTTRVFTRCWPRDYSRARLMSRCEK